MREYTYHIEVNDGAQIIIRYSQRRKSPRFPDGYSFAAIGRIQDGDYWRDVIRIDNARHQGRNGMHIHDEGRVSYRSFANEDSAVDYLKERLRRR